MSAAPFVGYPGRVWATCYQSMAWLSNILAGGAANASTVANATLVTYATLRNGSNAVAAYQTAQALTNESANLIAVQNMALPLDALTAAYTAARIASLTAAASGIAVLPPAVNPANVATLLAAGSPAVADPKFLEWCMGFQAETPPAALATSGLLACAQQEATAWSTLAYRVQVAEGAAFTDYRYDAALRTWRVSNLVASTMAQFQSGPFTTSSPSLVQNWNGAAALPAILLAAASLTSAPATLAIQQANVIRYALNNTALALTQLMLSLRAPNGSNAPNLATLRAGESLQDVAARTTGDFENWQTIAALNGIAPPYPGAANQTLALSGNGQLLLPTPGSTLIAGAPVPSYAANVLGTDWDFGPINGTPPDWTGDIPLITGDLNYARAIGRRIQTPLGGLVYHSDYGSRIPDEVGAVQGDDEAPKLAQFARAAVVSDPRTGYVVSSTATTEPGFLATVSVAVQPIGPGSTPVIVNETISPLP